MVTERLLVTISERGKTVTERLLVTIWGAGANGHGRDHLGGGGGNGHRV